VFCAGGDLFYPACAHPFGVGGIFQTAIYLYARNNEVPPVPRGIAARRARLQVTLTLASGPGFRRELRLQPFAQLLAGAVNAALHRLDEQPSMPAISAWERSSYSVSSSTVRKSSGSRATARRTDCARSSCCSVSPGWAGLGEHLARLAPVSSFSTSSETCGCRERQRKRSRTRLVAMV